ncbi:phospholipase D1 isoform X2 [Anabrus simplex]|uniref:phospholipase D1 isoform X2 n=1 Tax=Anabrus simplex TaxID=316456 RepID=UPI0035A2A63B
MTEETLPNGGMAGDAPVPSPDSDFDELFEIPDTVDLGSDGGPTSLESQDEAAGSSPQAIPFRSIHHTPLKFKAVHRRVFIPNTEVHVKIVDNERNVTTHLLNPNLYTIQLTHGDFTWTIKKRYKHFQHLHNQLKLYRTKLIIPFPTRAHRERRSSFKNDIAAEGSDGEGKSRGALPRFPNKPEALVGYEDIDKRIQLLEEYLTNLLKIKLYRNHIETVTFLEVSHLSFVAGLGPKGKEGPVLKRTGSTQPGQAGCNFCGLLDCAVCVRCNYLCSDMCGRWRSRWLFIKDTFLGYIRPRDGTVKCVMLFDGGFEVSSGMFATGLHNGLHILNHSRQLAIKCWTRRKSKDWIEYIKKVSSSEGREFIQRNRYNSFAPERKTVKAAWFVDGCSYMDAVADALEAAEEEIFIADWWLSPEIYMKRPSLCGDTWRLDNILKRKAEEGVKVFVMLYKEVEFALGINSYYSKLRLACSHENIKVLRHPDHAKAGVYLWAHHEKIVVVDQTYAFLGGIDLCYGRWDDYQHRLTDLGSVSPMMTFLPYRKKQTSSRPLGDSSHPQSLLHLAYVTNLVGVGALGGSQTSVLPSEPPDGARIPDPPPLPKLQFSPTGQPEPTEMPEENAKCNTPEMERKNIMDKVREKTETARSRGREWLQWFTHEADDEASANSEKKPEIQVNHVENIVQNNNSDTKEEDPSKESLTASDKNHHEQLQSRSSSLAVEGLEGMAKFWMGKDYTNFIVKDFTNLELPYQDLVDRSTTPRMPWHDVGVMVQGAAARDVARHFIQRWNAIKLEKAKMNPLYPYLMPKSYQNLDIIRPVTNVPLRVVDCQVVRSISQWSGGFLDRETFEEGIHEAYLDVIARAQHYIYLENQFFISPARQNSTVRNQIGESLFERIMRAHREGAIFRVYVILPLLPGFEGEVGSSSGTALHTITHWNYMSICRGKDAILNRLKEAGVEDPSEYISFYSLRNHSTLNGDLVSELIYVHSKLLIADDNVVICGSANINDRSMLGKRDSEVCVVLRDCEFEESVMNGEPYQSGRLAGSLRRYLFREHLGLFEPRTPNDVSIDVRDAVSPHFYRDTWMKIATENTMILEEVFHCIPSDQATSFHKLKKFQDEVPLCVSDPPGAAKKLEKVQGHLVNLPLEFLKHEVLTPNASSVQGMLPTFVWT